MESKLSNTKIVIHAQLHRSRTICVLLQILTILGSLLAVRQQMLTIAYVSQASTKLALKKETELDRSFTKCVQI